MGILSLDSAHFVAHATSFLSRFCDLFARRYITTPPTPRRSNATEAATRPMKEALAASSPLSPLFFEGVETRTGLGGPVDGGLGEGGKGEIAGCGDGAKDGLNEGTKLGTIEGA